MEACTDRDWNCPFECFAQHRWAICGTSASDDNPSNSVRGIEHLQKKNFNKGLAFSLLERQFLAIHGLLPAAVKWYREQIEHCSLLFDRLPTNLDKYMYLNDLCDRNQRLFYMLIATNFDKFMPIIYTPTVGEACMKYSLIYQQPRGMFITIEDKGHVYQILCNWPERDVRAIIVTDGERILGLGDLGANGMGIPVGKLTLYTALGGVKPHYCLPITLDCGTNRTSLLLDPLYIGLRRERVRGKVYDEFLDEFMHAVVRRFGPACLIHFEDFGNENAFRLLAKYQNDFCTFNDDIQGTGSVVLSGILVACRVTNKPLAEQTILFLGAGEANMGTAMLCHFSMMREGLSETLAKQRIWLFDTKGLVVKNRPAGGLTAVKSLFAQDHKPIDDFLEAVATIKPSILIGASTVGGAFSKDVLELMAKINERPIIFALSNPTNKAECTAQEAYTHTLGRCLFASGSPFPPVEFRGKKYITGKANNSMVFPGIAMGVICAGMKKIPADVFLLVAEALADLCTTQDINMGNLYPSREKLTCCAMEIAKWVMQYAYRHNLATVYPEPDNKMEFIRSQLYHYYYSSAVPRLYESE